VDENKLWNLIQTNNNKCKVSDWEDRCKRGPDWEKSIKEGREGSALDCTAIKDEDSHCEKKGSYEHACNCAGSPRYVCWNPQI
jgi:hypothetical protein